MARSKIKLKEFITYFPRYFSDMIGRSIFLSIFLVAMVLLFCVANEAILFDYDFKLFSVFGVSISGVWLFAPLALLGGYGETRQRKAKIFIRIATEVGVLLMVIYGAIYSGDIELFNGTIVSLSTIVFISLALFVLFALAIFWGTLFTDPVFTGKRKFMKVTVPSEFAEDKMPYSIWIENKNLRGFYSLKEAKTAVDKLTDGFRLPTKHEAIFLKYICECANPEDPFFSKDVESDYARHLKFSINRISSPSYNISENMINTSVNFSNIRYVLYNEVGKYVEFPMSGMKIDGKIVEKGEKVHYWLNESTKDNPITLFMSTFKQGGNTTCESNLSDEISSEDKISVRLVRIAK